MGWYAVDSKRRTVHDFDINEDKPGAEVANK